VINIVITWIESYIFLKDSIFETIQVGKTKFKKTY